MDDAGQLKETTVRRRVSGNKAVPLVVGVTGHRDLLPAEIPDVRERVRNFLSDLAEHYPDCSVSLLMGLAEGTDQLVAEEALSLEIPISVVLPLPRVLYVDEFRTTGRRENFDRLCDAAVEVFELPVAPGNSAEAITAGGEGRTIQFAQAGVFISSHCHVLLALWDGKESHDSGSTPHVVRHHQHGVMPGYTQPGPASRMMLADDESDLVYHIVVSRNRADGQPRGVLNPLECWWFTSDQRTPKNATLPARYRMVFACSNEFNRDAQMHAQQIRDAAPTLHGGDGAADLPKSVRHIDRMFGIADWLAVSNQKKSVLVLGSTHVLALLMGIMYIIYTNVFSDTAFIIAFVMLFALITAIQTYGKRQDWQRRALDYRALAEGLRVQYYWAASGVAAEPFGKNAYDNFLQMQDADLGWIRNAMRAAGTVSDATPNCDDLGLAYVEREWIGKGKTGRLGYYLAMGEERLQKQRRTERQSMIGLWIGIVAIAAIVIIGVNRVETVHDPLIWLMGVVLLLAIVRQSYAHATADSEQIKQYEFMAGIFHNARRRLASSINTDERRRVLRALGDAVLEEHAQWILMRRERTVGPGGSDD